MGALERGGKMIEAVKQIGDWFRKKNNDDEYQALCEDPNSNGKYKNILCITFNCENSIIKFHDLDLMEYKASHLHKYCYRSGSSNGPNCSPAAKITEVKKTFNTKIIGWFTKVLKKYTAQLDGDELNFIQQLNNELKENKEKIVESLEKRVGEIPKKEGSIFLTIRFVCEDEKRDLGDFQIFRKILQWEASMDEDKSMTSDQVCSLCGQKTTVCGNISTYTFYTNDKPGYICGGFREENTWKNYPVCNDCAKSLEKGRNYVDTHLLFYFTGLPFYLIPKVLSGSQEKLNRVLVDLVDDPDNKIQKLSVSDKSMQSITQNEKYIFEAIGGSKEQAYPLEDAISFHLLFLKKSSSAERIILHLEDVLPSRIQQIMNSKNEVDLLFGKPFTFFDVRIFFSKSDPKNKANDLDKYYLELIGKIFKGNTVNFHWLLEFIMKKIREELYNKDNKEGKEGIFFRSTSIRALKVVQFLYKLNLISMREESMEKTKMDAVFDKYENTFKTPSKRGLFLLGTLTELLISKQYRERKSKPFLKQLKGLKMNEKDFKGLLPKIQNKLEEYKAFDSGKRQLAELISDYLLAAGDNWGLTHDEMNFYFSTGMNLAWDVVNVLYEKNQLIDVLLTEEEANESN